MKRRWYHDTATGLASTDAMVRAETAEMLSSLLADPDEDVRREALVSIRRLTLTRYIGHALTSTTSAIVGLLSSPDRGVRETALKALTYLGDAALASYTGAIAGLITVPVSDARCMAVESLALACGAVANVPAEAYYHMCFVVAETLRHLKLTRVRLDCKTKLFYLQMRLVRPYALVWLEYAGKRLCTPGGMWAERDRAAFEKEFI